MQVALEDPLQREAPSAVEGFEQKVEPCVAQVDSLMKLQAQSKAARSEAQAKRGDERDDARLIAMSNGISIIWDSYVTMYHCTDSHPKNAIHDKEQETHVMNAS